MENTEIELCECLGCDKLFNEAIMKQDDADNDFCPECWAELAPVMKAEYEQLKANGEIDYE